MAMINSINFGNDTHSFTLPYGVCSTAADTAAKTVTVDNFSLETGATVIVKFTYASGVASPTLNVNGTGAKPIYRYGATAASTGTTTTGWRAGAVQMFTYDGTGWIRDFWENTTYSNVSLGQGYTTCSTAEATAAKTASLSSYALATGGIVSVKFTYNVPANATLNINSKGAKNIYYRGAKITAGIIKAGDIATFIYSSQYHLISIDRWQQDISSKQATITGAATTITSSNLTASRALVSDSSGKVAVSAVTSTELGYLDGVTSAIQTQLDGKAASSHNHAASNITSGTLSSDRLPTVPITKGGTGATTAAAALTNLGITATAAELNKMDGVTATTTELNYVDGVTSNIQTQLDSKVTTATADSTYASKSLYDTRTINVGRKASTTVGSYSLAFGADTQASANYTQAFGINSVASGLGAHAEGTNYRENGSVLSARTVTVGGTSYTVNGTTAQGRTSHAEGVQTFALGYASHSEGYTTTAGGEASHAEGYNTMASGNWSHSEGEDTVASAIHSHAEGYGTIASSIQQHVQGKYNIEDANDDYLHIVGNGGSNTSRSNAHTLDWDGNAWFAGDIKMGGASYSATDSSYVVGSVGKKVWIDFTDEAGNETTEPYIHWYE